MQTKFNSATFLSPRFTLGQIVATPAVLEHLERHDVNASEYLGEPLKTAVFSQSQAQAA